MWKTVNDREKIMVSCESDKLLTVCHISVVTKQVMVLKRTLVVPHC